MAICPTCGGSKQLQPVFVSYVEGCDGPPVQFLPCYMCFGEGEIADERLKWIEHGQRLKAKRLQAGYGLREFAEKMDVFPSEVSQVECGEIDNLAIDWNV